MKVNLFLANIKFIRLSIMGDMGRVSVGIVGVVAMVECSWYDF